MQLEEDIGMSIARRIWDGGIAAMSFVAAICSDSIPQESCTTALPTLRTILRGQQQRPLNILELGCGIGTLGIGMARILSLMGRERATTNILMTDVPEAEARARANMARQSDALREGPATLDFEPLDWEDGQHGIFGEKVRSRAWDLIMLSDCTYNTDTLQPLVKTLTALHSQGLQGCHAESSVAAKVLLATKPRHSSERIAFDLMAADGWVVREKTVLPLPVLDGEGQSVEVYLLEKE
jgi:SAM-dependent methyltransferase